MAKHSLEIAEGLRYIHGRGVVHRDLKPANVLLGADWVARLGDFGLAELEAELRESLQAAIYSTEDAEGKQVEGRFCARPGSGKPSGGFHRQHMMGTLHYTAPEVLMKRVAGFASDVYSLAVTCCELATCVAPFSDRARNVALAHTVLDLSYNDMDLAAAIASEGLRPQLPEGGAEPAAGFGALLERCWSADPAARPSAVEAAEGLRAVAEAVREREGAAALKAVWSPPEAGEGERGALDAAPATAADTLLTDGAEKSN